jgi:hypothetical protein
MITTRKPLGRVARVTFVETAGVCEEADPTNRGMMRRKYAKRRVFTRTLKHIGFQLSKLVWPLITILESTISISRISKDAICKYSIAHSEK